MTQEFKDYLLIQFFLCDIPKDYYICVYDSDWEVNQYWTVEEDDGVLSLSYAGTWTFDGRYVFEIDELTSEEFYFTKKRG